MTEHLHRRPDDPEGMYVANERAPGSWLGKNVMAVLSVIIGLGGGVLGSWVTTQVRETKTEAALAAIQNTVSELKGNLESMSKTVNAAAVASGKAQSDMSHMDEKINQEYGERKILESRTIVNEKDIARIQATLGIKK